jgi:hypothetical protein
VTLPSLAPLPAVLSALRDPGVGVKQTRDDQLDYVLGMGPVGVLLLAGGLVIVPSRSIFMLPEGPNRRRLPLLFVALVFVAFVLFVAAAGSIGG